MRAGTWAALGVFAWLALAAGCGDNRSAPAPAPASPSTPPSTPIPPPDSPAATPPAQPAPPSAPAPAPAPSSGAAAPAGAASAPGAGALVDGKAIFMTYCATCHGPEGKGNGPGAAALDPKPRDFTAGKFNFDPNGDGKTGEIEDLVEVVKNGAAKYGGSPNMVPWGAALTEPQLQALVKYVKSLSKS